LFQKVSKRFDCSNEISLFVTAKVTKQSRPEKVGNEFLEDGNFLMPRVTNWNSKQFKMSEIGSNVKNEMICCDRWHSLPYRKLDLSEVHGYELTGNGTLRFEKCKQLFKYQYLLLLGDIWWSKH
jgi:hypothetical protein